MIPSENQAPRPEPIVRLEQDILPDVAAREREPRTGWQARPSGAAGAVKREFSLADLGPALRGGMRIVGRYWWFGLFCGAVVGAVAWQVAADYRPQFTAEATLVARSPLDQALRRGEGAADDAEGRENLLRNHYAVMTSREFRRVLGDSLDPDAAAAVQLPYLEPGERPSPQRLQAVLAATIAVERERGRELFTVRVTHRNRETALELANGVADAYQAYAREDLRTADRAAKAALEGEADALAASIEQLEAGRSDFRQQFIRITGGGGETVLADRIKNLNAALSEVRVQRAAADVELRQAEADMERTDTPFDNPVLAAFSNTQELRAEIERRVAERAVLATHYGPNHPRMREADGIIDGLGEAIRRNFQVALAGVRAKVDLALASERQLQEELSGVLAQGERIDRLAGELATMDGEIAARRDALRELLGRIARAGISAGLPADVMRVVDQAYLRRPVMAMESFIRLAGVLGVIAAFLGGPLVIHACNRRVSSNTDVEALLGTELLGALPRLSWMWGRNRPHVVRRNRRHTVVGSFLAIASEFALRTPGRTPRRIVVSSTLPAEGKSVIASNLAAAFTRLGYRTLLVDADFRRPVQHRFNLVEDDAGLLDWIGRGCPEIAAVAAASRELGVRGLADGTWFLPAGGCDPEPARHWLRPETARLFEQFRSEFDVTIIDTPPAGLFPDAFFVAQLADATALVVREGVASTAQVRKVIAGFSRSAAPVTGLVFNELARRLTHPLFRYRATNLKYRRADGARRPSRVVTVPRGPAPTTVART